VLDEVEEGIDELIFRLTDLQHHNEASPVVAST
jgi:hypothetical protein